MKTLILTVAVLAFAGLSTQQAARLKDLTVVDFHKYLGNAASRASKAATASSRLSGGTSVQPDEMPWLTSLWVCEKENKEVCAYVASASLLKSNYLLTSGMACSMMEEYKEVYDFWVMTNTNYLYLWDTGVRSKVVEVEVPVGFSNTTFKHNLCTMKTADTISAAIPRAQLPHALECGCLPYTNPQPNTELTVASWGYTAKYNIGYPNEAQKATFVTIDNGNCQGQYEDAVMDGMVCAAGVRKSFCEGDTGAPAIASNGRIYAIATAGSSNGCESPEPVVMTRLCPFLPWINCQVGEKSANWWGQSKEVCNARTINMNV